MSVFLLVPSHAFVCIGRRQDAGPKGGTKGDTKGKGKDTKGKAGKARCCLLSLL